MKSILAKALKTIRQEYEIRHLQQKLSERSDLHRIRKRHAGMLFGLTALWIVVIWLAVFLQAFHGLPQAWDAIFQLSDAVLIAFITSTTASVLDLYGIAAYWLFSNDKRKPTSASKR